MTATYSMVIDWRTGAVTFRGANGRSYTEAEVATAEAAAARGDADAQATLAAIHRAPPSSREEAQALLAAEMEDCALCREARAHGDQPIFVSHDGQLDGWIPPIADRPTNWWHGRRPKRGRR